MNTEQKIDRLKPDNFSHGPVDREAYIYEILKEHQKQIDELKEAVAEG